MNVLPTCSPEDMFLLSKNALLKLYDERPAKHQEDKKKKFGSPITAITSLIGEDLVLGLFELFLHDKGDGFAVPLDYSCKTQGPRGPHLDAWIQTKKGACYQVEVKNWCASAKGGRPINDFDNAEWLAAAHHNYRRYLTDEENLKRVWKVVSKMQSWEHELPEGPKPLLVFWSPVAPPSTGSTVDMEAFFTVKTSDFRKQIESAGYWPPIADEVGIFSASNYLRKFVKSERLTVHMPRVRHRLKKLSELGFPINF